MTAGVIPTVPVTNNLNDFSATDIFEGELFYNVADGILFSRDLTGITVLGTPAAPTDLNTILNLGNDTGGTDIVISSNDRITNPPSLSPLESSISLGAGSPGDNKVEIRSEDTSTGDYSILELAPGLFANQNIIKAEVYNAGNGVTMTHRLSTDEAGFTSLFIQDATNNKEISVVETPMSAETLTTRDDLSGGRQSILVQTPRENNFSINDSGSGNSLTDEADVVTNLGWYRNTTGSTYSTSIEQYFDGTLNLEAGLTLGITTPLININTLPTYADDAAAVAGGLVAGDLYQTDGNGPAPFNVPGMAVICQGTSTPIDNYLNKGTVSLTIDGGGSVITTGEKGYIQMPYSGTITGWTVLGDQVGDIVIDVWKDTYANFPPTVADTIAGSEKPTLSSANKNQDLSLSTWTTSVSTGDIIAFNVDSAATVTRVQLQIQITKQ